MSLRLMYSPISAQVLLLNHLPNQDLESGDNKKWGKKWEETFPWLEFDKNVQGAFRKLYKKGGRSLQRTGRVKITNHSLTRRRRLRK